MKNPDFLKQKYDLHNAPEVKAAAKRMERRHGEKVPPNLEARIQNYLDRLECLILDPDKEQPRKMFGDESRPRALSLLREMVMNKYVRPNREKMAEGAARVEERAARELGIDARYGERELEQRGEIAVEDLEKSLDNWISYLSDANEPYPVWFRYYAFRNILDLGDYDKDKGEFTKRSQGSTRLFPDIDRGALAYVEQMIEAAKDQEMLGRLRRTQEAIGTPQDQLLTEEAAANFAKLSFAKQYAEGIRRKGEITSEMREETRGKWVKYGRGTDPTALWASLQNKGTAWCTKGFATAETQLKGGDFYVYYTLDRQGKPSIPRIAIRMQEESIGEVRGVADNDQNLEGNMAEIAEKKMNELPGAERYRKASADMKALTIIEKKTGRGEELTKNDLVFLYEINTPIEGFGYQRDPRIAELRKQRNPKEDAPIVLECNPDQIAWRQEEINENTKAYIGPLFPGIFQKNIEHVYTLFPEGKLARVEATMGGEDKDKIRNELKKREESEGNDKIYVSHWAKNMLKSKDFYTLKEKEQITLVKLKVRDLGFPNGATTEEIYKKAEEYGLELCPPETGPRLRLNYEEIFKRKQPKGEYFLIATKQIADSDGDPRVFSVGRHGDGKSWLYDFYAESSYRWYAGIEFTFCLRKFES